MLLVTAENSRNSYDIHLCMWKSEVMWSFKGAEAVMGRCISLGLPTKQTKNMTENLEILKKHSWLWFLWLCQGCIVDMAKTGSVWAAEQVIHPEASVLLIVAELLSSSLNSRQHHCTSYALQQLYFCCTLECQLIKVRRQIISLCSQSLNRK